MSATPPPAAKPRRKLGELLVTAKLISPETRNQALEEARKKHMRLGQYLVLQKVIKEIHLVKAISFQLKVEMYDPNKYPLDPELRAMVPDAFAFQNHMAPICKRGGVLYVAMLDPTDMHAMDEIVQKTLHDVEPLICTKPQLQDLWKALYNLGATVMEDTLVLGDTIDLDAIAPAGVTVAGMQVEADGQPAMSINVSSTQAPIEVGAVEVDDMLLTGSPSLELSRSEFIPELPSDVVVEVEEHSDEDFALEPATMDPVLGASELVEAEQDELPAGGIAEAAGILALADQSIIRRVEAVGGNKYSRQEVMRAALLLGLAVLEEEPGLVAALNIQTRDPWR